MLSNYKNFLIMFNKGKLKENLIITCCGLSQSGKTTFFNECFNLNFPIVDVKVLKRRIKIPLENKIEEKGEIEYETVDKNLVLVDVPGLNDSEGKDEENLQLIWRDFKRKVKPYGSGFDLIIFFYRRGTEMGDRFRKFMTFYKEMFGDSLSTMSIFLITDFPIDSHDVKKFERQRGRFKTVNDLLRSLKQSISEFKINDLIYEIDFVAVEEGLLIKNELINMILLKAIMNPILLWRELRLPKTPERLKAESIQIEMLKREESDLRESFLIGRDELKDLVDGIEKIQNQIHLSRLNYLEISSYLEENDNDFPILYKTFEVSAPENNMMFLIPWWSKHEFNYAAPITITDFKGENCVVPTPEYKDNIYHIIAWSGWAKALRGRVLIYTTRYFLNKDEISLKRSIISHLQRSIEILSKSLEEKINHQSTKKNMMIELNKKIEKVSNEALNLSDKFVKMDDI